MMVKNFSYPLAVSQALQSTISAERLSTYLAATNGNIGDALLLYGWNADISGALYTPLQGLEITLRNALHDVLSSAYSTGWYANPSVPLDSYAITDIAKAKATLQRRNAIITSPNMIAELSFGFWVSLLAGTYHNSLWTPVLHKAFPNLSGMKHKAVYHTLNHLRKPRNRIAHHEPIFKRHLQADYISIITAIQWISPETAQWVDGESTFNAVWKNR